MNMNTNRFFHPMLVMLPLTLACAKPPAEKPAHSSLVAPTAAITPGFSIGDGRGAGLANRGTTEIKSPHLVSQGDILVITPTFLDIEQKTFSAPETSRTDNNVCTAPEVTCLETRHVIEHHCTPQCSICVVCPPLIPLCGKQECCTDECEDVPIRDECVRSETHCNALENQWQDQTIYSDDTTSRTERITQPLSKSDALLDGLKIKIGLDPSSKLKSCSLRHFGASVTDKSVRLKLSNPDDGCDPVFSDATATKLTLWLVNEIELPTSYPRGRLIQTWDGRTLETPTQEPYSPRVEFGGSLSLAPAQ